MRQIETNEPFHGYLSGFNKKIRLLYDFSESIDKDGAAFVRSELTTIHEELANLKVSKEKTGKLSLVGRVIKKLQRLVLDEQIILEETEGDQALLYTRLHELVSLVNKEFGILHKHGLADSKIREGLEKIELGMKRKGNKPVMVVVTAIPGSGKSFISMGAFAPKFKIFTSDKYFTLLLKKEGLGTDLEAMNIEQYKQAMQLREIASRVNDKFIEKAMSAREDVVIESSGSHQSHQWFEEIAERFGYDLVLIYCKTTLETSLKRNALRKRILPEKVIVEQQQKLEASIALTRLKLAPDHFYIVQNDRKISSRSEQIYFQTHISKLAKRILG